MSTTPKSPFKRLFRDRICAIDVQSSEVEKEYEGILDLSMVDDDKGYVKIIDVGPEVLKPRDAEPEDMPKVGEVVVIYKNSGQVFTFNKTDKFRLVSEKDVIGSV